MKLKTDDRSVQLADQAAIELMEAMPAMMQFVRAEMRNQPDPSLSVTQLRALAFLDRNPAVSLSDVAESIGITRASASTMIDRLVQRKFVDRQEDPNERRHVRLNLTQIGSERLEEMRNMIRQTIAHRLNELNAAELEQVSEALALLRRVFHVAMNS